MDEDQTKEDVVEAEVVSTDNGSGNAQVLISMEGMIKSYMASIDKLEEEIKKHKDMLDDIFENDSTFKEHQKISKEAAKVLMKTKSEILKKPQAAELNEKVKGLKGDLKENQTSLSDYLQEYARMSGITEIEGEDGKIHSIVYIAKLVRK